MATAADRLRKIHEELTHESFLCIALIKPRSGLAKSLKLSKPSYCVFEYSPAFDEICIRWGDGSSQAITNPSEIDDLHLIPEMDEDVINNIIFKSY